jgi:diguanylate cyclase (GGDEF)-like protein/hemerythrin-like metal-binding protein/PAS domain S-box-containing protein
MHKAMHEASVKLLLDRGVLATAVARDGYIAFTSPKFDDIFGFAAESVVGRPLASIAGDADRPRVAEAIEAALAAALQPVGPGEPGYATLSFDAQRADGSIFEAELLVTGGPLGSEPAVVALVTDVTERRRTEKQLSYMAFLDALTGLPNRALFLDRLRETLTAARGDGRTFAVMMCDLDGFKKVNDTLGHEAGDALLHAVARHLEGAVRQSDTVARQGGDEFAVILSRVARRGDASIVAERMIRALDEPIEIGGKPCKVGISIGVATYPENGDDMDTLVARADAAMYESKRAGKNRHTFAEHEAREVGPIHLDFFHWSDAHAVGVAMVDAQHRHLVTLLNQLGDDLKAGRARDAILASLRELVTFTQKHFATEERLMEQCPGWPQEAAHGQEHKKLIDDLTSLGVHVEAKSMTLTLRFLQEWLLRHIEGMDRPMGIWLREHGGS